MDWSVDEIFCASYLLTRIIHLSFKYMRSVPKISIFYIMLQLLWIRQKHWFIIKEIQIIISLIKLWSTLKLSSLPPARQRDKAKQTDGSPVALFNFFIQRVRDQLHVVLAMSPIGDAFRTRLRKFPSLVNCCTIDWFQVCHMSKMFGDF